MDAKALNTELERRLDRDAEDIDLLCRELGAVIGEALAHGDSVAVPSFGSFEPRKRNERVGVHPSTGRKILVPPKLSVAFRPSAMLKLKIRRQ